MLLFTRSALCIGAVVAMLPGSSPGRLLDLAANATQARLATEQGLSRWRDAKQATRGLPAGRAGIGHLVGLVSPGSDKLPLSGRREPDKLLPVALAALLTRASTE